MAPLWFHQAAWSSRYAPRGLTRSIERTPSGRLRPPPAAAHVQREAKRDLAPDLLRAVREMKAGRVQVVSSPVIEARRKTGLSQSRFAALLGVSVRALQGWEQGRKQPSGAARTLLAIANRNPKALLEVADK